MVYSYYRQREKIITMMYFIGTEEQIAEFRKSERVPRFKFYDRDEYEGMTKAYNTNNETACLIVDITRERYTLQLPNWSAIREYEYCTFAEALAAYEIAELAF